MGIKTKGIYISEANSDFPEYEILMPHHSKLKYLGKSKDNGESIPTFIIIGN